MPMESKAEAGSDAARAAAITDTTAEFEEYTAPPRLDEHGRPVPRSKGLAASGYQFPPPGGPQPPLTKANLAKGIGVPDVPRAAPTAQAAWPVPSLPGASRPTADRGVPGTLVRQLEPAPIERQPPVPAVKVAESELFEEYRRPDHDKQPPRTGKGIRTEPPGPPSAKEILQAYTPPEPEVVTPKRFGVMLSPSRPAGLEPSETAAPAASGPAASAATPVAFAPMAPQAPATPAPQATQVSPAPTPAPPAPPVAATAARATPAAAQRPASRPATPAPDDKDAAQAELDARSDLAASPTTGMAMSNSVAYGPIRTVIHHDDEERQETLSKSAVYLPPESPGTKPAAAPAMQPLPAPRPHLPDLPALSVDGPVPRIGIVQAQFNLDVTDAMMAAAQDEARRLGVPVAATVQVPGVYDIPLAAKRLLARPDIDAVVALGCVIQGETGHDELITHATAQTLLAIACNLDKPVGLGVTGPRMTRAQAEARIGSAAFAVASVVAQHRALKLA